MKKCLGWKFILALFYLKVWECDPLPASDNAELKAITVASDAALDLRQPWKMWPHAAQKTGGSHLIPNESQVWVL